jgi:hypothetical protein
VNSKLSEEAKKLINNDTLLNNPEGPKLLVQAEQVKIEPRKYEISKYSFMNDEMWMK